MRLIELESAACRKMLFELLILASLGLLMAGAAMVLAEMVKAQVSWWRFQRETRGLPMSDGRNILCNHAIRWGLCKNVCNELKRYNEAQGRPKIMGWLLGDQYAACTIDPEFMKRIVLDQPNKNINRAALKLPLAEYVEDNIMLAYDDQWRRLRRAVAPAMRANKFKAPNVMSEIESSIDKLIAAIEGKFEQVEGGPNEGEVEICIEADDLLHRYSLDLVFSCFYKQYDQIDFAARECKWTRRIDEGLEGVVKNPLVKLGLMLGPLRVLVDWAIWNFHPQGEWRREVLRFIRLQLNLSSRARKRLQELRARAGHQLNEDNFLLDDGTRFKRNMADYFADHLLDGKITEREFMNTSSFLVGAADKTAADALVHTLYQLATNRDIQRRLREAIRSEGAEAEYLAWVVNEALRLMPPVPIACSRSVAEDTEVEGGHMLPKGTLVVFPAYIVHRLKEYWGPDAEEFKPERWRDTAHHHPLQYVPFGAGVRQCPGREFALFEMKELLARLLLRYEFHCQVKPDAFVFDSPFLIYLVYNSPTFINVRRVAPGGVARGCQDETSRAAKSSFKPTVPIIEESLVDV